MPYNKITAKGNMSFKKMVAQCILRTLICSLIGLLIYASITAVVVGIVVKPVGYEVLHTEDGENFETVYTYIYTGNEDENWVDEKLNEFMQGGNYYKQTIPGKLDDGQMSAISWCTQVISFIIWFAFIYTFMWNVGNADADKNELGNANLDKFRGLKSALFALIPFALAYVLLVITKIFGIFDWSISLFKILNFNSFAFNNMIITGGKESISASETICLAATLIPLPLFSHFSYRMGNKHIKIKEKLIYKNADEK